MNDNELDVACPVCRYPMLLLKSYPGGDGYLFCKDCLRRYGLTDEEVGHIMCEYLGKERKVISGVTTLTQLADYLEVPLIDLINTFTSLKEEFDTADENSNDHINYDS